MKHSDLTPSQPEQLELFSQGPFMVRLPISQAVEIFIDSYWSRLPKWKTTKHIPGFLRRYFAGRNVAYLDEIRKSDIEDMRDEIVSSGYKPETANTYHGFVSRLISWWIERKEEGRVGDLILDRFAIPIKNPATLVPRYKTVSGGAAWPKKVVRKLIETAYAANDHLIGQTLEMLYLSNRRPGDIWRMTSENVDLAHRLMRGIQNKSINRRTPSGRPYLNAIGPRMAEILKERMSVVPPGEPLFRDPQKSVDAWAREFNRRFNVIRKLAGLPHVQANQFRHSGTTLLLDNGVGTETAREIGGWTTDRMLPIYNRRNIVHLRQAQEKLEDDTSDILK